MRALDSPCHQEVPRHRREANSVNLIFVQMNQEVNKNRFETYQKAERFKGNKGIQTSWYQASERIEKLGR